MKKSLKISKCWHQHNANERSHIFNENCYNSPTIDAAKWNYLYSTPVTLRQTIMGKWQQKAYNSGSHTCYFQYINIHTGFHLLSFSAFCLRGSFVAFLTTGITIMQLTLQWWGRKRHSPFAHLERLAWKPFQLVPTVIAKQFINSLERESLTTEERPV